MIHAVRLECCERCGRVPVTPREHGRATCLCGNPKIKHFFAHPTTGNPHWQWKQMGHVLWGVPPREQRIVEP